MVPPCRNSTRGNNRTNCGTSENFETPFLPYEQENENSSSIKDPLIHAMRRQQSDDNVKTSDFTYNLGTPDASEDDYLGAPFLSYSPKLLTQTCRKNSYQKNDNRSSIETLSTGAIRKHRSRTSLKTLSDSANNPETSKNNSLVRYIHYSGMVSSSLLTKSPSMTRKQNSENSQSIEELMKNAKIGQDSNDIVKTLSGNRNNPGTSEILQDSTLSWYPHHFGTVSSSFLTKSSIMTLKENSENSQSTKELMKDGSVNALSDNANNPGTSETSQSSSLLWYPNHFGTVSSSLLTKSPTMTRKINSKNSPLIKEFVEDVMINQEGNDSVKSFSGSANNPRTSGALEEDALEPLILSDLPKSPTKTDNLPTDAIRDQQGHESLKALSLNGNNCESSGVLWSSILVKSPTMIHKEHCDQQSENFPSLEDFLMNDMGEQENYDNVNVLSYNTNNLGTSGTSVEVNFGKVCSSVLTKSSTMIHKENSDQQNKNFKSMEDFLMNDMRQQESDDSVEVLSDSSNNAGTSDDSEENSLEALFLSDLLKSPTKTRRNYLDQKNYKFPPTDNLLMDATKQKKGDDSVNALSYSTNNPGTSGTSKIDDLEVLFFSDLSKTPKETRTKSSDQENDNSSSIERLLMDVMREQVSEENVKALSEKSNNATTSGTSDKGDFEMTSSLDVTKSPTSHRKNSNQENDNLVLLKKQRNLSTNVSSEKRNKGSVKALLDITNNGVTSESTETLEETDWEII